MVRVTVLMATFQGRQFVQEQLESILAQTHDQIDIFISDDGSTDGTRPFVDNFASRWNKGSYSVIDGPKLGKASENFRNLFLHLAPGSGFVSLADQDDIWRPEKLQWALEALAAVPDDVPAVACSRTRLIDAEGHPYGYSRYFTRPPSFRNAVVQSLAGGNTMVLNPAAAQLVAESFRRGVHVPAHDWWIYMLVTGAGGQMLYREQWDTLYRQHGNNAVGDNQGWLARVFRLRQLLAGSFRDWNDANEKALETCRDLLSDEARQVLALFSRARREYLMAIEAVAGPRRLYRQTPIGHLGLIAAAVLKKI